MSEAPDVYRAICQVATEMSRDGISKNKKNEQQGYKFRGIDDIYNALSAVIAGAGLCILPRMSDRTQEERTTQKGGVLFYVTVRAEFDLVSAKDGSKHTVSMYGEAMDSADKATNKAMSAAYKYACMQVFCIPTEGMEDADSHTPEPTPKQQPSGNWAQGKQSAKDVADKKLAEMKGGKPYRDVSAPGPRSEPRSLEQMLATFTAPAPIADAFKQLKAAFVKVLDVEVYRQILHEHGVNDETGQFVSKSVSQKCFTTIWNLLQKEQSASGGTAA